MNHNTDFIQQEILSHAIGQLAIIFIRGKVWNCPRSISQRRRKQVRGASVLIFIRDADRLDTPGVHVPCLRHSKSRQIKEAACFDKTTYGAKYTSCTLFQMIRFGYFE